MDVNTILEQGRKIDDLMAAADALLSRRREACDRIYHSLQSSFTFVQGENTTQDLAFNVAKGSDFEATRLMLYPEIRCIATDTSTQGPDDRVFRPTAWFVDMLTPLFDGFVNTTIEALVSIAYHTPDGRSRPYSSTPWFAGQTFGGAVNIGQPTGVGPLNPWNRFETPGGLMFNPFFLLRAGSALTASVTPTYSGIRQTSGQDGRLFEYRIRGVLEGFKRVGGR